MVIVLKVGYHGSRASTGDSFQDKVNHKLAVISVGKGNSYGHTTQKVMNRLQARGILVCRTDENRTIVATSNENDVTFNTDPGVTMVCTQSQPKCNISICINARASSGCCTQ